MLVQTDAQKFFFFFFGKYAKKFFAGTVLSFCINYLLYFHYALILLVGGRFS